VKKPTFDLGDALVESELQKVAINEGTLESRPQAEAGDYITGHALMVGGDGTKFYDLNGAVVQSPTADRNGKGMILGVMVDDFSKQLGSPKPGETFTVKCKGPENHEVEKIRGADLTITFKVDRVDRIIPASMDQLVAAFGLENADRLKELVRRRLEQNAMIEQQTAMRQQVCKALLDATTMDLPERLSARQAARTLEQRRLELMYRGVDAQKIEEHMAELRASSSEIASRELKLFFLLAQAAEKLNVRVDDGEINSRIAQMAFQRNMRPEQLRSELMQSNQISGVYQQIRDHKTLDAILSKATVTEMPAEEFNKQMEAQAKTEGAPAGKKKK
jgi:trigger factor